MEERRFKQTVYITIDAEKCKGCKYCIGVCPNKIINIAGPANKMGSIPAKVIPDKANECIGCGSCFLMCPDSAISIFSNST